jgi:hypothetical protein
MTWRNASNLLITPDFGGPENKDFCTQKYILLMLEDRHPSSPVLDKIPEENLIYRRHHKSKK